MEEQVTVFMENEAPNNHQSVKCPFVNGFIFPYQVIKRPKANKICVLNRDISVFHSNNRCLKTPSSFLRGFIFNGLSAAEKEVNEATKTSSDAEEIEKTRYDQNLEALARAYIQKETGWDRVKVLFQKDHRGKTEPEMGVMQAALLQVFVVSFFMKYFPKAMSARKQFIRDNQGTVFRTQLEAVRLLQDHISITAGREAAKFSFKVTMLSSSFMLISSIISHYRNKTSVMEFAVAAGVTGGLSRMNMGLMGLLVGTTLGGVMGTFVGVIGYVTLSYFGATMEERHLEAIKNKLEVHRYIDGEKGFQERVNQILAEDTTLALPPS